MSRIYISSTYEDLKDHRELAYRALRRLHHDVVAMEDYVAADQRPLDTCLEDVANCDVYVGLIGWRYGFVPTADNPSQKSITELEYRKAQELKKPRLLFLVDEAAGWPPKFVDKGPPADRVKAFRDEITDGRLASFFASDHELAEKLTAAVVQWERREATPRPMPQASALPLRLRARAVTPALPDAPYPLLEPYTHPATFGGRDVDLDELERRVRKPQLVLCLHAPSGAGKSSLLQAGLVPRLRDRGYVVTMDRHPSEPSLVRKIIGDVFDVPGNFELRDDSLTEFVRLIGEARAQSGDRPPIIILDQIDDALRLSDGGDQFLVRLGPLMAATAQRLEGERDYLCRWVLCYRHEFHGLVGKWLEDVLRQARARGDRDVETLPFNLSEADRVHTWALPLVGAPPAGGSNGTVHGVTAFQDAIERPLTLRTTQGTSAYEIRFAEGAARRLAEAFARARARGENEPLVPELQVVLGHLLDGAARDADGVRVVSVPEHSNELDHRIDEALNGHLRRALEEAFPLDVGKDVAGSARARALLALRHLADAHGLRGEGIPRDRLASALGQDGHRIVDRLASSRVRLIVEQREGGVCGLSHDRMAAVVTRFAEEEPIRRSLGVDERIMALRRVVDSRTELWKAKDPTAPQLRTDQHRRIALSLDALVWTEEQRGWWNDSVAYQRRRWKQIKVGVAAITLAASVVGTWVYWTRSDAFQVRAAFAAAPVRDVAFSSRSDDDPWLETLQGWVATLVQSGRESEAEAAVDAAFSGSCLSATIAAERRASQGLDDPVLAEVQTLIREGTSQSWQCLSLLPLSGREKALAVEAANGFRQDDRMNDYDRERAPIEVVRLLVKLGDPAAARDQALHALDTIGRAEPARREYLAAMLAQRVRVTPWPEVRKRILELSTPDGYNGQRMRAALELGEVTIRGIEEYVRNRGGIRSVYDEYEAMAIGEVFARAIHEGRVEDSLTALDRTIAPVSEEPVARRALAAILDPVGRELASSGRVDEALRIADRALASASQIESEEGRSRALANVACLLARCGRLLRAREIADRCQRSLDRLRAYTSIVRAGELGDKAGRGRHVHDGTVTDGVPGIPTAPVNRVPAVVFSNADALPRETRAELEDVAQRFLDYMADVGFDRGAPITVTGGDDFDVDDDDRTITTSRTTATPMLIELGFASILVSATAALGSDLHEALAVYYAASFGNTSVVQIPGEQPFNLAATAGAVSTPEPLPVASALWDLRSALGAATADRLVCVALEGLRGRSGDADDAAFVTSLVSRATVGGSADEIRDILKRHGFSR